MIVSVFVGTSVDGFIARQNGSYDCLPDRDGEPHGYREFIASVDTLVIGRKTFEAVLALPAWPYGGQNVAVLTSKLVDFSGVRGNTIQNMAGSPAAIVATLAAKGAQHVYVHGGITVQRFRADGLVQRIISTL